MTAQRRGRKRRPLKADEAGTVVARLEPDELAFLHSEAQRRDLPLSAIVREALRDYMLRGPVYDPHGERRPDDG